MSEETKPLEQPELQEDLENIPAEGAEEIEVINQDGDNPAGEVSADLLDPEAIAEAPAAPENVLELAEEKPLSPVAETHSHLQAEIDTLKTQLEERNSQYMRIAADFDNFRKRTSKEKMETEERSKRNTIAELLPVIDNFERARAQVKPQTEGETSIHQSYQGIYKQFVDCLKQLGVSPMRPEGQPFDPNFHEAVMREPTEEYEDGTVIEELRRGYLLGEQVLRHSMVRVAAPPEPMVPSEENSEEMIPRADTPD
jgi:molecular chaperone GrpE